MTTTLVAPLQRPQQEVVEVVHKYMEVVQGLREVGSSGVRVRAAAVLWGCRPNRISSDSRGRLCRIPMYSTSFPRREALVSAMSEGESDITDMQENDKVNREWWQPAVTAMHEGMHKLLGLAELADGSLFFSFGGSVPPRHARQTTQPRAQHETKTTASLQNLTPASLPHRLPSTFRKHSPIPSARKKGAVSNEAATSQPPVEDRRTQTAQSNGKPGRPPRHPSTFSKRSPIPKAQESRTVPTSEKQGHSSEKSAPTSVSKKAAATAAFDPEKDSPFSPELKEILNYGKEEEVKYSSKSKTDAKFSRAAPAKKKVSKSDSGSTESTETPVENGALSKDLGSYKLPELRILAKARGLKGYSKLKKGELVDLLNAS